MSQILIRPLTTLPEFNLCVAMEEAIWGYNAGDMIPRRLFLLASRIGGQVLGAFTGEGTDATMVGFAMGIPGYRNGLAYLHSHMVGVLPDHRNQGIARRLKLAQRDDALARGLRLMEWTFDPLEIRNAHLNIARLGCIVRRYEHDFYGPSSSPLQGGLPTDRLVAEWWLASPHMEATLSGKPKPLAAVEQVQVPAEVYAWKASAEFRQRAREVQARNADALESAFARGLAIVGYERSSAGDGTFLLGEWTPPEAEQASEHKLPQARPATLIEEP